MATIVITGANGFIGRRLVSALFHDHVLRCIVRTTDRTLPEWNGHFAVHAVGNIGPTTEWENALRGADVVVHLAAVAHRENFDRDELERVNIEGVRHLAAEAVRLKVRRIVLLSSIGVHGNVTSTQPFNEMSPVAPHDSYSMSKVRAEEILALVAERSNLETVVARPPLVYGAGAPGNFAKLIRLVRSGVPLPFGLLENKRSMISIENLCDFIANLVVNPRAANRQFVVCDGEDVSIPTLIRLMAMAMNVRTCILPVPEWLLRVGLLLAGRSSDFTRLCGSLQVDASLARQVLEWRPPQSLKEGLADAVANPAFRRAGGSE